MLYHTRTSMDYHLAYLIIIERSLPMIRTQLEEKCADYLRPEDIEFVIAVTQGLEELGYSHKGLEKGYMWGKYMIIFRKADIKSPKVYARIYIRENHIVLRMYFNNVTKHANYILACSDFIQHPFTSEDGNCTHCSGEECKHRKKYEIDGVKYEKCDGYTFEFHDTTTDKVSDYLALFCEFFPPKKQV